MKPAYRFKMPANSQENYFALRGSRQHKTLRTITRTIPKLMVLEVAREIFLTYSAVENHKYEYVFAIDSTLADIANRLQPKLTNQLKTIG